MRAPSILQPGIAYRPSPGGKWVYPDFYGTYIPECYVSGWGGALDVHHIYPGNPNRRISDENGFWVYLRHDVHMAAHERREPYETLLADLQRECQEEFEKTHTREEFRALIGRSYL